MTAPRKLLGYFFTAAVYVLASSALAQNVVVGVLDRGIDVKDYRLKDKIALHSDTKSEKDKDKERFADEWGWNSIMNSAQLYFPRVDSPEKISLYLKLKNYMQETYVRSLTTSEFEEIKTLMKTVKLEDFNEFFGHNHGQHIAGIILKDTLRTKIIPVTTVADASNAVPNEGLSIGKIIEQEDKNIDVPPQFLERMEPKYYGLNEIRRPLYAVARFTLKHFLPGIDYVKTRKMKLVNLSYGSEVRDFLARVVGDSWDANFKTVPPTEVWTTYVQEAQRYMSSFFYQRLMSNRDKLFIMAAGNWQYSGTNEANNCDTDPSFPSSVTTFYNPPNILLVAATVGQESIANFSGYGAKSVHVAAPGVRIDSYMVGGGNYKESGTSQATAYVTNTAAKMLEANPQLTIEQVRAIIIGTVDKKDFLKDKVLSGGIINQVRAVRAAQIKLTNVSLDSAIENARLEISDL